MKNYIPDLLAFMDASVVNFCAVAELSRRLDAAGFTRLDPARKWDLQKGGKYYVTKNDSAIFAFTVGSGLGFRIISAHSDSPGFRVKPHPEMLTEGGILKLNVEVYGGPILYTWFDRPLSLAGRVIVKSDDPLRPRRVVVRLDKPLLTIPHLAIHFNRSVNEGNPLSKQKDMLPVIGFVKDAAERDGYLLRLVARETGCAPEDILDFDLSLYDTTPACLVGPDGEFVTSGRLDDLSMAHAAVTSLIDEADAPCVETRVAAIFDNEETGSGTKQGAKSPFFPTLLRRITSAIEPGDEPFAIAVDRSFMISADNAHALHPNYPEKQDPTNHPVAGGGPVIKINANCKYMTDADSAAVFRTVCERAGVPYQYFVNHSDSAGGSTLGNLLTGQLDLRGVDMGIGMWAMHSVRETMAAIDQDYTIAAFREFFRL